MNNDCNNEFHLYLKDAILEMKDRFARLLVYALADVKSSLAGDIQIVWEKKGRVVFYVKSWFLTIFIN